MCGICGIVDTRGANRTDLDTVRDMTARIRHRGPDGDGFFATSNIALGMRRLSIIDVLGSDQPLYNEDRTIALVFNGEIYNYRELRADLIERGHRPHTDGDGETLIYLYEEYGLDLFARLRGMYAFALWDAPRRRLVLAVDHIGMKPLYLWERDGILRFASEVKCFMADADFQAQVNAAALDTYLSFGYMIGEDTLFDGVRRLPAGHALIAENGMTRLEEYWQFGRGYKVPLTPYPPLPRKREEGEQPGSPFVSSPSEGVRAESDVIATARDLLTVSVHLHLRSDVPLGLFLSGGVDSAAVLSLMAREAGSDTGERVKTYTIGYDASTPDNELLHARRIAAHFGADHHERVIKAEDWWNGFERYVYHHDEPNANSSAVSLLLLAEMTAQHVKVVLTGLGGDELFGGYANHRIIPQILASTANGQGASKAAAARTLGWLEGYYPAFKRYRGIGALPTYLPPLRHRMLPRDEALMRSQSFDGMVFSDTLRVKLYSPALREAAAQGHKRAMFDAIIGKSLRDDPFNTAQALVINTWLTGNALLNCDKVTMAHSLEARIPFFDPNLLAFAAAAPSDLRMRSNKYILREAMRPLLPSFAIERPKQPFGTPILNWFATDLKLRIQEKLLDQGAFIRQWFDVAALERLLRGHFNNTAPQVEVVFRLLTLEQWGQVFVR
jgi:asparagine synthase (glutamine-hydrolysing)